MDAATHMKLWVNCPAERHARATQKDDRNNVYAAFARMTRNLMSRWSSGHMAEGLKSHRKNNVTMHQAMI
jgi:hypothetical protein